MGLLSGLWGSISLGVTNSFTRGFWSLGLASLVSSFLLFGNMSVECFSESVWSSSVSSVLVLMSLWVGGACYLSTKLIDLEDSKEFSLCVLVLATLSAMLFMVSNWFALFFLFESSLLPIGMLILGWGYQPERLQAAGYMVMYTVSASLPLLVALAWIFVEGGNVSFFSDFSLGIESKVWGEFLLFVMLGAFLVKSPVFMVHSWLPKAHVEAPVSGSMMLAGVLLKFGGYGCILVYYFYAPISWGVTCFLMGLVLWGGLFCGFMCFRQVDMKSLIAYSSIGHMALCLGGFMTCYSIGWNGGLILMVAHGLCSPGLFALSGYTYSLFSSRSMFLCKGALSLVPSLSLAWFLFCSGNMAFPPSVGLLGEIMLIFSLTSYYVWFMVPLGFMVFVTGVYSLILYSLIQHGRVSGLSMSGSLLSSSYMTMSLILWVPLNLLAGFSDVMKGVL